MPFKTCHNIYTLLFAIAASLLLTTCSNAIPEPAEGEGTFAVSLTTDDIKTEVITRSSLNIDVNSFKVSLSENDNTPLFQNKAFGELTQSDCTLPAATGYRLAVESCSETEAITLNEGWGEVRFTGSSSFDIVSNQNTKVAIVCSMENAGIQLSFDPSFINKFPVHAATIQDSRNIIFKSSNQDNIAYYNLDGDVQDILIKFTGTAGGWSDRLDMTKSITLNKGKITVLRITYNENTSEVRMTNSSQAMPFPIH